MVLISFGECKVACLLYADDLGITPAAEQKSLNVLSEWCKGNGVVIIPSKTKTIYFRHPRKIISQTGLSWCGNDSIEYIDCYNYLGVKCTESWAKVFESTSLKASS